MTRQLRKGILAAGALLCLLVSTNALAVPAAPIKRTFQQPDGTTFTGVQQGDEWFNWYRASDGKVFVHNPKTKAYEYGELAVVNGERKLQPSGVRVGRSATLRTSQISDQSLWELRDNQRTKLGVSYSEFKPKPGLKPRADLFAPQAMTLSTGRQFKTLVVIVQFTDYTLTSTLAPWSTKFFGTAAGTVNHYYDQVSGGQVSFVPAAENHGTANDGFVIVTLDKAHPLPGDNHTLTRSLATEALALADASVDFSVFDTDANGELSSDELQLLFLFAGPETSYDGIGVWGHKWTLISGPVHDNVKVGHGMGNYVAMGERHGSHDATIGIIVHELGHSAFGLPDLYPQAGNWDVMSGGSWGSAPEDQWAGQTPVLMSAWTKWRSGLLEPTWVDPMYTAVTHGLRRTMSGNQNALVVPTQNSNFQFLLEHRRFEGYDRGILFQIGSEHDGKSALMASTGSGVMQVVRADNAGDGNTKLTNLYYPGNVVRLAPDTTPSTAYNGTATGYVFENIAHSVDEMTVSVRRDGSGGGYCQIFTATNSAHVTAGRAYTVVTGTWIKTTTWYANGSNQSLGTASYTSTTLKESPAGYFVKGTSCPAQAAPVIQSFTDHHANKYFDGMASDAEDDIARIEVEFNGNGQWLRTQTFFGDTANQRRYSYAYRGLSVGSHAVRVRAIDAGNRISAVFGPQTVTVDPQQAPSCQNLAAYRDADDYWVGRGEASDADNDLQRVEVRLDGGAWNAASMDNVGVFQTRLSEQPHGTPGALPDGTHTVEAQVWDKGGLSATCGPLSFEVGSNRAPAVLSIDAVVYANNIDISGEAADMDADLTGVELELNGSGQWLASDSFYLQSDPRMGNYNHRFAGLAAGTHVVRVRAVDSSGLRGTGSDPVTVQVAVQQAPSCTVNTVAVDGNGYTFASGVASDPNNDIIQTEVKWIGNDSLNGQWIGMWGTTEWGQHVAEQPLTPGSYLVEVRVRDSLDQYGFCSKTYVVPGASSCFTAANSAHASANRATLQYVNLYYAKGSNDYLGLAATVTSLQEQSAGHWKKVTSCP